eukprot:scaffold19993_cov76-Amphora_coffeaeformis.AAC.1
MAEVPAEEPRLEARARKCLKSLAKLLIDAPLPHLSSILIVVPLAGAKTVAIWPITLTFPRAKALAIVVVPEVTMKTKSRLSVITVAPTVVIFDAASTKCFC